MRAPSTEVATIISEDATVKVKQIIGRAIKFMRHSNRTRLTCTDINKALRWSDSQPIFGHEFCPNQKLRYSYSAEAQVFRYESVPVDLVDRSRQHPRVNRLLKEEDFQEALPVLSLE